MSLFHWVGNKKGKSKVNKNSKNNQNLIEIKILNLNFRFIQLYSKIYEYNCND